MENPIKMHDLGVPLFSEPPILPSLTLLFCCLMESSLGLTLVSANQQKKQLWWPKNVLRTKIGSSCGVQTEKKTTYTPRKRTWNLKMMVFNRNILFQGLIFRFHVSFRGCKLSILVTRTWVINKRTRHYTWWMGFENAFEHFPVTTHENI